MSTPTCEERIDEQLLSTAGDIKEMYKADIENGGGGFDNEYGLCIDVVNTEENGWTGPDYARYQISWGGPSSEFRFFYNGKIEYWFMDWFDGAHRDVTEHEWAQWLKHEMVASSSQVFRFIHFGEA